MKYEYKTRYVKYDEVDTCLNKMANNGWEFITAVRGTNYDSCTLFFRRNKTSKVLYGQGK